MGIIDVGDYTEERKDEKQGDKADDKGGWQSLIKELNSFIIHTGIDQESIDWGVLMQLFYNCDLYELLQPQEPPLPLDPLLHIAHG